MWLDYRTYTLAFHPPMTTHHDDMSDGTRFFMIELDEPWVQTIRAYGSPIRELRKIHGEDATWLAVRLHQEYLRGDEASDFTIESLLFELCGWAAEEAGRVESHAPAWLAPIDDLLEREPDRLRIQRACRALAESDASLAQIAADLGFVDQSHLSRTFRETVGTTPAWYRRERYGPS